MHSMRSRRQVQIEILYLIRSIESELSSCSTSTTSSFTFHYVSGRCIIFYAFSHRCFSIEKALNYLAEKMCTLHSFFLPIPHSTVDSKLGSSKSSSTALSLNLGRWFPSKGLRRDLGCDGMGSLCHRQVLDIVNSSQKNHP